MRRMMALATRLGLTLALLGAATAHAQIIDGLDLATKLYDYHGKGSFLLDQVFTDSPKFLSNYDDCRARGESDEFCKALNLLCVAQEQPFFGGQYVAFFQNLGLNQVFKLDCGSQECFQCCHVPGQGCHTSFIGFPVINCNPSYGAGTSAAGRTLVVDPDARPGEACLTIPQTCDHIPLCATEPPYRPLRDELDAGRDHPLRAPGAPANRARSFGQSIARKWCGAIDRFHTGLPRDPELPSLERVGDIFDFLTGRGCEGWRANVAAAAPYEIEPFLVFDEEGNPQPASAQRDALCQWGLFRALVAIPGLAERLTFVESTVWPDDLRDAYLARVDDPDQELLRHASPVLLDLLRCVSTVYDYRLLAVPLEDEVPVEGVFNGCVLGHAPRVFLDVEALGEGRVELAVDLRDPEAGGPHAADVPLTIWWGDGRVSLETIPVGQAEARFEHVYTAPGARRIMAMVENTSGLRGFGAVIAPVEGAGLNEEPLTVSELRIVDVEARTETLTGNARTLSVEIWGHDPTTDVSHPIGRAETRQIDLFEPTPLGTWIAHNTGAAPLDRFVLRFRWRDGFYTGLRSVTLRGRIEMHVFDPNTGEAVVVEVPISPETVRAYGVGEAVVEGEPLPERYIVDEMGEPRIVLHDRDARVVRVEIDVPSLAEQAPGPRADDAPPLAQESWFEARPGQFAAVGRGPDAGPPEPDAGIGDGGIIEGDGGVIDAGANGDGGGATGCSIEAPGRHAPTGWALLGLVLIALRRRPRSADHAAPRRGRA